MANHRRAPRGWQAGGKLERQVRPAGQRFTLLPIDNPIGFFFEAMYRTGPYWYFIGAAQVVAAVLLLIPRTAALGAVLFLPVGTSVFLVTWGLGFGSTTFVTGAMLLSGIYLVCWDGDRVWTALATMLQRHTAVETVTEGMHRLEVAGWTIGGMCGMGVFLNTRGFVPGSAVMWLLIGGACAALMVVTGWMLGWQSGAGTHRSDGTVAVDVHSTSGT